MPTREVMTLVVHGGGLIKVSSRLDMGLGAESQRRWQHRSWILTWTRRAEFRPRGPGGQFLSARSVPNVHNYGGFVQVGNAPNIVNVAGDYLQEANSILPFPIAGTLAGSQYSQLAIGGSIQLGGTLQFVCENGFAPQAGQTFDLITVGDTSQLSYVQIEIQNLAPGFTYSFAPFSGGYRLTALTTVYAIG